MDDAAKANKRVMSYVGGAEQSMEGVWYLYLAYLFNLTEGINLASGTAGGPNRIYIESIGLLLNCRRHRKWS